jgi:diguanylate cyclase (GGDEF)-like protein
MELGQEDEALGELLQRLVIAPNVASIVDAFYARMLEQPAFATIMRDGGVDLTRLKRTQTAYLLSLGVNFHATEYFERRLRVGLTHAWAGVPLGLAQAGYRLVEQLLVQHILADQIDPRSRNALIAFVIKIIALDFALTIESYHGAQVQTLEHSVQTLRRKGGRLYRQATIDLLTETATRRHILRILKQALRHSQHSQTPLSVIMVDVDLFKDVNDRRGHTVGDQALHGIAARIRGAVRDRDQIGRYGGEEFLVVLPETSLTIACEVAERMRERVAMSPIHCQGTNLKMTISLGVVQAYRQETAESLIVRADGALYRAKREGRNRAVVEQEGRYRTPRSTTVGANPEPLTEPARSSVRAAKHRHLS